MRVKEKTQEKIRSFRNVIIIEDLKDRVLLATPPSS